MGQLRSLDVSGCSVLGDAQLAALCAPGQLAQLRELRANLCRKLRGDPLPALAAGLPALEVLSLHGTGKFTEAGLRAAAAGCRLAAFAAGGCAEWKSYHRQFASLQAEGSLASLALLTGLTDVKLPAMELTAAAVQHLATACHGLRSLDVSADSTLDDEVDIDPAVAPTVLTDATLAALAGCAALRALRLDYGRLPYP